MNFSSNRLVSQWNRFRKIQGCHLICSKKVFEKWHFWCNIMGNKWKIYIILSLSNNTYFILFFAYNIKLFRIMLQFIFCLELSLFKRSEHDFICFCFILYFLAFHMECFQKFYFEREMHNKKVERVLGYRKDEIAFLPISTKRPFWWSI